MNDLTTVECVDRTERVHRLPSLRSCDNASVLHPCNDLTIAVLQRFRACPNLELRRLRCEVRDGNLNIHGQVSSYYLKQLAQETVRSLAGDNRIVNLLNVVYLQSGKAESVPRESQLP